MSALSLATPFQGGKNWSWSFNQIWILCGFKSGGFLKTGSGHRHVPVSEFVLITELVVLSELVPIARSFHMQLFCYLQWVVGLGFVERQEEEWSHTAVCSTHDRRTLIMFILWSQSWSWWRSWSWSYFIRRLSFPCNQCWLSSFATKIIFYMNWDITIALCDLTTLHLMNFHWFGKSGLCF